MPDASGRLTAAEAKEAVLAYADEVLSAEPGELAAEKPEPRSAVQHVREAAAEELTKERPAATGGDLDAQLEALREIFEIAGRDLAPGRGRAELERQLENFERRGETPEPDTVEKPAASRPDEPGKDWSSVYAGMSSEELDAAQEALIDAQVAVETEYLSAADFAYEPGVETAVVDEDEDEWTEELGSLPDWAPAGQHTEEEEEV